MPQGNNVITYFTINCFWRSKQNFYAWISNIQGRLSAFLMQPLIVRESVSNLS